MLQKQIIIEKLLDVNKNQIKNNCHNNGINQSDKRQGETSSSNKVVHQSSKEKGNPNNEHVRNTGNDSNSNTRKKITVIGDSVVRFLRSDEMSSVNTTVNVMKHPGSTTDDMVDYVRLVTRKKPDKIYKSINLIKSISRVIPLVLALLYRNCPLIDIRFNRFLLFFNYFSFFFSLFLLKKRRCISAII